MVAVKEMPYSEKYAIVLGNTKLDDTLSFVKKTLGDEAVIELQSILGEKAKPIPKDASDEEKYEIAYGNWIWKVSNAWSFVRKKLGEAGFEQFVRVLVEGLKRKSSSAASLLRVVRAFSSGFAFTMISKKMAYLWQCITPFSVSELSRDRAVFNVPRCKVLDYPDCEVLCTDGCQRIYPMWMAEQFKVKMETDRQGKSCTITLTPL